MRDGGRIAAAIDVLEAVLHNHQPVKNALRDWGKTHRFAGSSDRAWISGLVLDALRHQSSLSQIMQDPTPRALVLAACCHLWAFKPEDLATLFLDNEHAPDPVTDEEKARLCAELGDVPLHIRANIPQWLEASFVRAYGQTAEAEGQAMAGRAPVDLRINTLKTHTDKAVSAVKAKLKTVDQHPWVINALRIPETDPRAKAPGAESIPAYGKGWVEVQDIGSQLAALAVGNISSQQVLDYCAGAGGKSLALAALAGNKGQIYAWDYDWRRLRAIWPRLKRAGVRNVQVRDGPEHDALSDLKASMDLVLIDAPCSGSGTWRRRPDAKWRLKPTTLEHRIKDQDEVLSKATAYVKPGGRIVYVTCSVLPEENEDRIEHFLSGHPHFKPVKTSQAMVHSGGLAEPAQPILEKLEDRFGAVQLSPNRSGTDGFYVCVMEYVTDQ